MYPYNLTIIILLKFSISYYGSLTYNPYNFILGNNRIDARGN